MTRIFQTSLFLFILAFSMNAQPIYLKYDTDCLERFEYLTDGDASPYISYVSHIGNGEIVHMDVGVEDPKWVRDLPAKAVYCNAVYLDQNLVNQINAGTQKLYMVTESPTHYNISEVKKAVYIRDYPEGLDIKMEDADFMLRKNSVASNRDLSVNPAKKVVMLEGTRQYQCATGFVFRKNEDFRGDSYKEYIVVPEIGIVSKGAASRGNMGSFMKLDRVDKMTFSTKLNQVCDALQASYYDGVERPVKPYEELVEKAPAETPVSYGNTDPCAPTDIDGLYVVQKGETLYGISRRFGISIDQIKSWNKIGADNLINVCQKLYVKVPSTVNVPGSAAGTATTASTGNTAVNTDVMTPKSGYWMNNSKMHEVRPGESIAALAEMYGYTEDRFRKMNSLGPYERIYAGQKLYTTDCICPTLESTTVDKPLPYEAETPVLTSRGNPDVYFRPIKVHTVQKEETLFAIARQYDTTVDRLLELNGLSKGATLNANQRIYVQ